MSDGVLRTECSTSVSVLSADDAPLGFSGNDLLDTFLATPPNHAEWQEGYLAAPSDVLSFKVDSENVHFSLIEADDSEEFSCANYPQQTVVTQVVAETGDEEVTAAGEVVFSATSLTPANILVSGDLELDLGPSMSAALAQALSDLGDDCESTAGNAGLGGNWRGMGLTLGFLLSDCKHDAQTFWDGHLTRDPE